MSYYDNPQWSATGQNNASSSNNNNNNNNWDHQGATTPVRAGASAPQPQDDYAFSYQFDEVDRAYENLQKSGKGFVTGGRHGGRVPHAGGSRSHSLNFDAPPGGQGPNLHNFYASQRHQSSRGSNEAEQVMQAKRRMAAQRERELRNLHTEQQYQRTVITDMNMPGGGNNNGNNGNNNSHNHGHNNSNKHMTEEESRELIARQRSALYAPADPSPRPQSTTSPSIGGPTNKVFDNAVGPQSRTSTSSPTGGSPPRDLAPGSKAGQSVAPIGTRPSGTPTGGASSKRSTTPMGTSGGWGRGNGVWGQSSGLGAQASVWG